MPPIRLRPLAPSAGSSSASPYPPLSPVDAREKGSCDICKRSYKNSSSLERHKREKHEKAATFDCRHCGQTFQRPEGLRNHIVKTRCSAANTPGYRLVMLHNAVPGAPRSETASTPSYEGEHSPSHSTTITTNSEYLPRFADIPRVSGEFPTPTHIDKYSVSASIHGTMRDLPVAQDNLVDLDRWVRYAYTLGLGMTKPTSWTDPRLSPEMQDKWKQLELRESALYPPAAPDDQIWSPCTTRRSPLTTPFPPAFDIPAPQDLEYLIWQQDCAKRRLRMMESFQSTHRKFMNGTHTQEHTDHQISQHQTNFKQAWRDGVAGAKQLLSGTLPRELHSVLGITQVASAIRSAVDDIDPAMASEDKFLSDLGRWRQLLPSDSHAAFDHYADLLWDKRPPSNSAWKKVHDAQTLVYFQDLLAELLSHVGSSPPERATINFAPDPPAPTSHPPSLSLPVHDEALPMVGNPVKGASKDYITQQSLMELALYSAGAIFALIVAFLLRKSPPCKPWTSLLTSCFSVHESLHSASLVPLLHHRGLFDSAACIPSCELPAPRTLDPAIGDGPHPRCSHAWRPTSAVHAARRFAVAAAHRAVLRRHCRRQLRHVRCLMMF
jgi:hypothetical protein